MSPVKYATLGYLLIHLLLAAANAPAGELTARLADGSSRQGACTFLDQARLELLTAAGPQSIPLEDVESLTFANARMAPPAGSYRVHLRGGSRFQASQITSDGQTVRAQLGETSLNLQASRLLTVQLQELDVEQQRGWKAIAESATTADVLVLLRPTGALTKVEGIVLGLSEDSVQFELDGQQVDVAFEKLAGVRFFGGGQDAFGSVQAVVRDVFQSEWICSRVSMADKQGPIKLELRSGDLLEIPWEYGAAIDYSLGRRKFLADLEPTRYRASRLLGLASLEEAEAAMFGMRRVRTRQLPGKVIGPSLEFAGDGEVSFDVPDGYTGFSGAVHLQPRGNRITPCTVQVIVEGALAWECQLAELKQVEFFEVPVAGGQRLRLVVSSKSALPTGNVVFWEEPKLTR